MKEDTMRGKPILGVISGLFLGAFGALDLALGGVRPIDNASFFGLPIAGAVLGFLIAWIAPFRRRRKEAVQAPA